jgi:hypothetical protein
MSLIHLETARSPIGHGELFSGRVRQPLAAEETCRLRLIGALGALAVSRPPFGRSCIQELEVPSWRTQYSRKVKVS